MRIPTWAYVVGVCMILFGGCSLTQDIQSINVRSMMEAQMAMLENLEGEIEVEIEETDSLSTSDSTFTASDSIGTDMGEGITNMAEGIKDIFNMSDYAIKWTIRFGYIGLFLSLLYIFGGVFLMVKRKFSIKLAYTALLASIVFSIVQTLVMNADPTNNFVSQMSSLGYLFGMFLDLILLVVILACDKSAFGNAPVEES